MAKKMITKIVSLSLFIVLVILSAGCAGNLSDKETQGSTAKDSNTTSQTVSYSSSSTSTSASTLTTTKKTTETKSSTEKSTETATTSKKDTTKGNGQKLVALTFDDGPYSPVTNRILDTLQKYGAKATFFVVGNRVSTYSSAVKRASDMGCEIGSHSYSHKNLTKLSASEMKSEISKSDDAIKNATGKSISIVRPPEGATNDAVRANVNYPLIMWSVDSLDWKYRNATTDYNNVMNGVFDGSIILMHDLYPATADAVEKLVPDLISKGYKFVTVTEMYEARGEELKPGQKYFNIKP